MRKSADHRVIIEQGRRRMLRQNLACLGHNVFALPLRMQVQIDGGESELAHLLIGCAIGACAHHLLEELGWNRGAVVPTAREKVQGISFPTPVLHDLRWQLDEIPSDVGSRETAHAYARQ